MYLQNSHYQNQLQSTFKSGSTTYFYSSLIFDRDTWIKVARLYAFVRTFDNFVDIMPQKKADFYAWKQYYKENTLTSQTDSDSDKSLQTEKTLIDSYKDLEKECDFKSEWTDAFLAAMESDIEFKPYQKLQELEKYMYGSAEVIGLMMSKIMQVPEEYWPYAQLLGKAMQYTNFLRDIDEDNELGRQYIPQEILDLYGLNDLSKQTATLQKAEFENMMQHEIDRALDWYSQAKVGINALPFWPQLAVQTATSLYAWSLTTIKHNPTIVFEKKVKPSRLRVLKTLAEVIISATFRKVLKA